MIGKPHTLILTRKDVDSLLRMKPAISAVEGAFKLYGQHKAQMPPKIYLHLEKYQGDFRAMPAYVEGIEAATLKWVNVHLRNQSKGLVTVMATIILSDPRTGFPRAIMDGTSITNVRTGAAGAIAAKYLAKRDSTRVGLVGCGEQAFTQLKALGEIFSIKTVNVWGLRRDHKKSFLRRVKKWPYTFIETQSVKECVHDCDIVVTTTPSRKPLVRLEWLMPKTHINAIGADAKGKQELDAAILKGAKVVVDDWQQASHSGEINVAVSKRIISRRDIYAEIGDIINDRKKGRMPKDNITVFDSTGLAIQDTALAHLVYQLALKKGKGRPVNLIGL